MPTVIPYATPLQAANATTEILSRWRDGTLAAEGRLLVSQAHLIGGYGLSVYPGSPDEVSPIVPIGSVETMTFGEAEQRLNAVVAAGGFLVQGSSAWFRTALKVLLTTAVSGLEEPLLSIVLQIINNSL